MGYYWLGMLYREDAFTSLYPEHISDIMQFARQVPKKNPKQAQKFFGGDYVHYFAYSNDDNVHYTRKISTLNVCRFCPI